MIKITCAKRVVIAQPNAGWSCSPGANHFDEAMPEAVSERFAELEKSGEVKIETLAVAAPQEEPKPKKS